MKVRFAFIAIAFWLLAACQAETSSTPSSLEGLWIIQNVQVGDEEMTPDGRWIRFHSDSTHESGNGWLQHSYGDWSYTDSNKTLKMNDQNGTKDPYPAFTITLEKNAMQWTREEEGYPVTVNLKRGNELPQSRADKVIGIWNLNSATRAGASIIDSLKTDKNAYLYLAWDKRFTLGNTPAGRKRGMYFVHPHRAQLQLFSHSILGMDSWRFEVHENELVLRANTAKSEEVVLGFERGDDFND